MFFFDPGCVIEFTGAAEILAYHRDVLKRSRRYKLVQATSITNIDDVMTSAQARLP